ncbi:3-phosphoshikimate 1-carboxyvinyltransferase [Desulfurivibrio dismutans]|uniref:3-phosphoshikimate 1-carboxyvinyltransferase n=1 Tax=Desulfurivibrio dismutans TaxID=1398908 RepID=UPI0023DC96FD|nr:3-phosphoshikimate 1-carboxyvinyltransferase [Desulfurivibrio alkaliphilus]MDF1614206.1 3-phosphoshikimate 1-carboxyvinyltransferase [Desulfurivibrio alkaliphilus]
MSDPKAWQEITPSGPITATVAVPGSKSITQRALIAAALAKGESFLHGPLASEDTDYTTKALQAMGMTIDPGGEKWRIFGQGGLVAPPATEIYLGNNGTATRFLTSVAALGQGIFLINGDERMQQRPIEPLLQALRGWGVQIRSIHGTGCPPLEIQADGLAGGPTVLPEGKSSQYLSSLLLVSPYARQPAELKVEGEVLSKPYVVMTLAVMREFGIEVEAAPELNYFKIPRGGYRAREYRVEGDASSASYFWAAAAVTGGQVTVTNVPFPSLQGDAVLVDIFEKMGCRVERNHSGISVAAPEELQGVEVDMGDCPDVVPTLAVVAALARGRTRINNIAHLRIKECDRLGVMAAELAKLGVKTEEGPDYLVIEGRGRQHNYQGAEIATHNDHRIAMSFAVAGLAIPGMVVENPGCVAKSFPDFWQRFAAIG